MKLVFHILICFIPFIALLSGCKKILEEKPKTFVSPDAFYTSPSAYELTVIGIYRTIPSTLGANNWLSRESFSDIIGTVSGAYEQGLPVYQNNHQPFFYNVRALWSNHYAIVKDANFIIKKIENATILTDAQKNSYTAEARFLRAYAYFQLVQLFGDVSLRTDPLEDLTNVQIGRSPQQDVYNLIIDDLKFAETNLPKDAPTIGRVYKLVATALLAKVYLTMAGNPLNQTAHYADARDKALEVINSGTFTLKDDYADVFHHTSYTSESIWEQTYQPGVGGNPLMSNSATAPGYTYILTPAAWFINSFPNGDQRKAWGIKENYAAPSGTLAPFFQKFVNLDWIDQGVITSNAGKLEYTIPLLRLGEMYLIAAEAENEINGPGNAYQYINKIRWRARINKSDPAAVPDLSGLSKDEFRAAVLMERKWELHLEGSTWYDLKRTNTLSRIQDIRGDDLVHPIGAYNNTWYIPDNEITNNNIPQNPTYQ
ncbi:MAG: RagB/SusD family nutrient uptake outer membrane protein [Sphingobacteriales bacterium]|mgnify:CR=1 FL=1|nr:RagB/SusD family nutrient uptake outer membrane protein [Sphingobacteriales bacterium]OJY81932.1 MAG: RagB/SusD family nutrient uptake outer membrane protein [Sphingobacteriales bacterium 44-15]